VFDVIVRPLFRSLSRPLFRALTGFVSTITKVLIDLSPTSNGFYSLGTDSVLTTAYKLGISTVLPTASTTYALFGRASSATDYLKLLSSGYLSLDVNGTVVTSTVLATKDSEYREYSVTLDGNDFIFKENNTIISTVTNATAAAKTLTLNLIGNSNSANFYLGILADAVMGDFKFKINKLTGTTESSILPNDLVSNNAFNNTTDWSSPRSSSTISVVSNKLRSTAISTDTFGSVITLTGLEIGGVYLFKGSATSNNASATVRLRVVDSSTLTSSNPLNLSGSGSVSANNQFIANATTMYMGTIVTGHIAGDYVDIDAGASVNLVPKILTYENTPESARDIYTLSGNSFIGTERWDNITIVDDWVDVGGGLYTITTTANIGNNAQMISGLSLFVGSAYQCQFTESGFTGNGRVGFLNSSFTETLNERSLSANGEFDSVLTASGSTLTIFRYVDSGTGTSSLTQVSIKRRIGVA
jgi:hypothetical protein